MRNLKLNCWQQKLITFLLFCCCMNVRAFASASVVDVHNIAEICTSVQTVLKDYALVGMGVKYDDPEGHLKTTIEKIDKDFAALKEGHHLGPKIDALVIEKEKTWKKIREIVVAEPRQDVVMDLHIAIEKFDKECWEIAEMIALETHVEGEHYVIVASELGMEVQRLAALYMMRAWDVSNPHYFEEVETILEEFEKYYHELAEQAYPKYIGDATKAKLDKIEKSFLVFEHMAASKSGRFVPALGQRSATRLIVQINDVINDVITAVEKK
ncbi:hypothetical protein [Pseudoteredinibacter isoporae]|uniref:hypothetical protein n=1 Tax=Pseudoteredinibacter isoporae TaxID=570281 RepID=UPI003341B067